MAAIHTEQDAAFRRQQFDEVCSKLPSMDPAIAKDALQLFESLGQRASVDDFNRHAKSWALCCIYTELEAAGRRPGISSMTLADLLHQTGLSMTDFMNEYTSFAYIVPGNKDRSERVADLKRTFELLSNVYRSFDLLMRAVFVDGEQLDLLRRFTWLLFLIARGAVIANAKDLVMSVHLAVACVHFVASKANPNALNKEFEKEQNDTEELLALICRRINADKSEVRVVTHSHLQPFILTTLNHADLLRYELKAGPTSRPRVSGRRGGGHDHSRVNHIEDVASLVDEYLLLNTEALDRQYSEHHLPAGSFDARMCLAPDFFVINSIPSLASTNGTARASRDGTPHRDGSEPPVPAGLKPRGHGAAAAGEFVVPQTPVRRHMDAVARLKEMLGTQPSQGISPRLHELLQKCGDNGVAQVVERLQTLQTVFVDAYLKTRKLEMAEAAQSHFALGIKLYLRVLEAILETETQRMPAEHWRVLLSEMFHKALLACSLEVVIFSYGLSDMEAPWILKVLSISYHEFLKVIEPFLQHEPVLSREMSDHLLDVKEIILMSSIWESSSEVFKLLGDRPAPKWGDVQPPSQRPHLSAASSNNLQVPGPDSAPGTPKKSTAATSVPGTPGSQYRKEVEVLFRMLYNSVNARISRLCDAMGIGPDLKQRIWTLFEYAISTDPSILRDRHLDHVMACCIFGMARVSDFNVQFKEIINKYKEVFGGDQRTWKTVLLKDGKTGNIINFYNDVFMEQYKDYMLTWGGNSRQHPPLSPLPTRRNNPLASPSRKSRVSHNNNVFLSSPRKSPHHPYARPGSAHSSPLHKMTPRRGSLYAHAESPHAPSRSAAKLVFDETGSVRPKVGHSSLHFQRRIQAIEKEHGPVKMEVDSDK